MVKIDKLGDKMEKKIFKTALILGAFQRRADRYSLWSETAAQQGPSPSSQACDVHQAHCPCGRVA